MINILYLITYNFRPDNIFLDESKNIKIGDFGLALEPQHQSSMESEIPPGKIDALKNMKRVQSYNIIGTPLYRSPEQENGGCYDEKTDIYSMGLILFEMLSVFSTSHERYLAFRQIREKGILTAPFNDTLKEEGELIKKMTSKATDRPSTNEVISVIDALINKLAQAQ